MSPRPTSVSIVDPDELMFAIQLGQAAAMHKMPTTNPEQFTIDVIDDDPDGVSEVRLTDNHMNRFSLAVQDHCDGDKDKFIAIMKRWFALLDVCNDDKLSEFTTPSKEKGACELRTEVIVIAATMPLDDKGRFNPGNFFRRVEAMIGESSAA